MVGAGVSSDPRSGLAAECDLHKSESRDELLFASRLPCPRLMASPVEARPCVIGAPHAARAKGAGWVCDGPAGRREGDG